jgi:hypothetical protein
MTYAQKFELSHTLLASYMVLYGVPPYIMQCETTLNTHLRWSDQLTHEITSLVQFKDHMMYMLRF